MELSKQKINDVCLINISGKLDSNTSPEFEKYLMSCINSGDKKIVLECSSLDYISSAGLRVLLLGAKVLKSSDGRIILSGLKEHINQVIEIAGFTSIFTIYPTAEEAIKS